jgi:diguanylate cyclase (GGDEF)-like protein
MTEPTSFIVAIVDDDESCRRLVGMLLKRSGYCVPEYANGEEARSALQTLPWDMAILDRRLPDIDGVVLCHDLKSLPEFRNRYIILLTGESDAADKVEGLDLGADDYITKPFQPAELLARIRAGKRIVDLQKELIATNKRLELLSITDGLTQLYNHRHFQEELAREFEEASRYERPLSLAMIDIDFFKKINDAFGHAAGDKVLQEISSRFGKSIRTSDLASRYGGEEFTVLMPETNLDDALLFAEKIRSLIEATPIETPAGSIPVTVSIGVATFPHSTAQKPRELLECADKALYRAKRAGRNQVNAEKRRQPRQRLTAEKKSEEETPVESPVSGRAQILELSANHRGE